MDKRGERSINQANQELGGMSRIFGWGFERGYVKGNPCKGVRKFTLKPREVYVTDEEYQAIYDAAARAFSHKSLKPLFEYFSPLLLQTT